MREIDFDALTTQLIKAGIAPRHAHRTVLEFRDHYDDLVDAAVDEGAGSKAARQTALQRLGSTQDFVAAMSARRELKSWAYRFPKTAALFYPVACLAVLPAWPLLAGVAHSAAVVRWGSSFLIAGFFTAFMLLMMQLSIFLG